MNSLHTKLNRKLSALYSLLDQYLVEIGVVADGGAKQNNTRNKRYNSLKNEDSSSSTTDSLAGFSRIMKDICVLGVKTPGSMFYSLPLLLSAIMVVERTIGYSKMKRRISQWHPWMCSALASCANCVVEYNSSVHGGDANPVHLQDIIDVVSRIIAIYMTALVGDGGVHRGGECDLIFTPSQVFARIGDSINVYGIKASSDNNHVMQSFDSCISVLKQAKCIPEIVTKSLFDGSKSVDMCSVEMASQCSWGAPSSISSWSGGFSGVIGIGGLPLPRDRDLYLYMMSMRVTRDGDTWHDLTSVISRFISTYPPCVKYIYSDLSSMLCPGTTRSRTLSDIAVSSIQLSDENVKCFTTITLNCVHTIKIDKIQELMMSLAAPDLLDCTSYCQYVSIIDVLYDTCTTLSRYIYTNPKLCTLLDVCHKV